MLRALSRPNEHPVAELYRAHFDFVWQVLQKLGVDPANVEDAAHDVFVVAHRRWADFRGDCAPRTWLFAVARRVASRHRRTDARRARRHAAYAVLPPAEPVLPDGAIARKQAWERLLVFLDGLEPSQREVFVLGELEALSRSSLGEALGINANTAYSRLRSARRKFEAAFPSPAHRRAVRAATATPSPDHRARVWALLAVQLPWSPLVLPVALLGSLVVGSVVVASNQGHLPEPRIDAALAGLPAAPSGLKVPRRPRPAAVAQPNSASQAPIPPAPATPTTVPTSRRRPSRTAASAEPTADNQPAPPGLSPAMQALNRARRALRAQQLDEASALLEESERLDASNTFSTERSITRVWVLCASNRPSEARAELERLRGMKNTSAYADILSNSCVGTSISSATSGHEGVK